jgi:hypothetical protein
VTQQRSHPLAAWAFSVTTGMATEVLTKCSKGGNHLAQVKGSACCAAGRCDGSRQAATIDDDLVMAKVWTY